MWYGMWIVVKVMGSGGKREDVSRSAVLLEGEKSTTFSLGCSLSPIFFSVFIAEGSRKG